MEKEVVLQDQFKLVRIVQNEFQNPTISHIGGENK
jgi:hypothetical protein